MTPCRVSGFKTVWTDTNRDGRDDTYGIQIDGSAIPNGWDENGASAPWGKSKVAPWYEFGDDDLEHVFVLKGEPLSTFADDDEADVNEAGATCGLWGDGSIKMSRLPGARISDNDKIVGDGGKGRDRSVFRPPLRARSRHFAARGDQPSVNRPNPRCGPE